MRPLSAQTTESLWPDGLSGVTEAGEGDDPKLIITQVKRQEPTAAVVILPGGGYRGHAIGHEGYEIAEWFRSMGITSAICTYRMRGKGNDGQGYGHPAPMRDAQRAIKTLRGRAKELNVDPERVGVIGFSAGGHLASTVATQFSEAKSEADDPIERVSSRPDFCILGYPVIAFGQTYTHRGSQRNLLGEDAPQSLIDEMSSERRVSDRTPPTFLFHTGEDTVVPVRNSIEFYLACQQNGVPAELHVFPQGKHGVGLAKSVPGASWWPKLCEQWLQRQGMLADAE